MLVCTKNKFCWKAHLEDERQSQPHGSDESNDLAMDPNHLTLADPLGKAAAYMYNAANLQYWKL